MSAQRSASTRAGAGARYLILGIATLGALVPSYLMVTGAFKTQEQFLNSPWSLPWSGTTAAFQTAWDAGLLRWLVNTVIICGGSVAAVIALAALAGWGFANWRFRGRQTLLGIIVSLMVVPPVVLLVPLFQTGAQLGWINTFHFVIITYTGLMLPFSIYLLATFFASVPRSLLEAATVDGASSWRTFTSIVLPLSAAPLATLTVVNLLWAWNELLLALVFLQDEQLRTLMVGLASLRGRYSLDIPTVLAGLSLATLPLVVAYLFGQRYFIRGLTAGGLKGE
ncbi:MAG: carbohydrate ABC transporter permease [Beutenbergiaceae bacterium]